MLADDGLETDALVRGHHLGNVCVSEKVRTADRSEDGFELGPLHFFDLDASLLVFLVIFVAVVVTVGQVGLVDLPEEADGRLVGELQLAFLTLGEDDEPFVHLV